MGKAVAKQLAAKGANIVIVARNVEKLKAALEYIAVSFYLYEQPWFSILRVNSSVGL